MFLTRQTSELHLQTALAELRSLTIAIHILVHLQEIHGMVLKPVDDM
jgi:hypothetical protein